MASTPLSAPERSRNTTPDDPDALGHYLADVGDHALLDSSQEAELSRRVHEQTEAMREAMSRIPWVWEHVVQRWRALESQGRVTSTLSSIPAPERSQADRQRFDRSLRGLEACVERQRRHRRRRVTATTAARLEREARAHLRAARLSDAVWDEAWRQLRRLASELEQSGPQRRREKERTGLSAPAFRARMDEAERAARSLSLAKNTFVEHNLKLAITMARRFRGLGVPLSDLIQEANMGLMRAVERFDHRRGHRFSTYAGWWIRQSLVRAVQNHSRVVRLPTHLHERLRAAEKERSERERRAAGGEVVEDKPERPRDARALDPELVRRAGQKEVSLDAPVRPEEGSARLGELVPHPDVAQPEDGLDRAYVAPRVLELLRSLEDRERRIVAERLGLTDDRPRTLEEVGRSFGISRERTRQIQARALRRLREQAQAAGLDQLLESQL